MKTLRIPALFGLFLLVVSVFATTFSHVQMTPGAYSTTVTVPTAANCNQFGGAYNGTSFITNYGPLGNYACNAGQSFNVNGEIAAGDWYVDQVVNGSGYSGTVIYW